MIRLWVAQMTRLQVAHYARAPDINTAVVLMVTQARVPASAQSPPPCVEGDVNGDFSLDISDCVYTLQYLFEGGPSPVACAQSPTAMELEDVLAKFFLREADRYSYVSPIDPAQGGVFIAPIITVPAGKTLVIDSVVVFDNASITDYPIFLQYNSSSVPDLLSNGVEVDTRAVQNAGIIRSTANSNVTGYQVDLEFPPNWSAHLKFQAGDILEIETMNGVTFQMFGYWADAP